MFRCIEKVVKQRKRGHGMFGAPGDRFSPQDVDVKGVATNDAQRKDYRRRRSPFKKCCVPEVPSVPEVPTPRLPQESPVAAVVMRVRIALQRREGAAI